VKLVIFDCDGTLVDSQHVIVASMVEAFRAVGLAVPPRERILGVVGLSLDIAVARLVPPESDLETVDRIAEAYKASFGERRRRPDHAEPLYDGIRETLDRLSATPGVVLGIATGKSRRGVDALLAREGLAALFATIQTADTNPSKPHPSMIVTAMDETGFEASDTVMIGDTSFDIEMAAAAGVLPVGVSWGYHPAAELWQAGASAVANDCNELAAILDAFFDVRSPA
jgi:phosphoglycolate phosphatase